MAVKTIQITNNVFNPPNNDPFVIAVGDSVKWHNNDNDIHNVVSDGTPAFNLDDFGPGDTPVVGPFNDPTDAQGIPYECTLHSNMTGRLIVTVGGTSPKRYVRKYDHSGMHDKKK